MDRKPNIDLAKKLNIGAIIVSIVVLFVVAFMRQVKLDTGIDFTFLPPVYSSLNCFCALSLIMALVQIKKKNIERHRMFINISMFLSVLFLCCYVLYHFTTPETLYCKQGAIRYVYFTLLISHIILAGVILPFILFTYIRGYTWQIPKHRKLAKIVFPLWLYVAVSGPIIYLMLKDCY